MKQRITYLLPEGTGIDPKTIKVEDDQLQFSNARRSALEKRVTVGLSELPDELSLVLEDCHELHIRWSSPSEVDLPSPVVSRIPPGLHVFFTPRKAEKEVALCQLLQKAFGEELKCHSVSESFSRPPVISERFAASSTYQYYHVLPSLDVFRQYAQSKLCAQLKQKGDFEECLLEAERLDHAATVDLDFDIISHAVALTATWSAGSRGVPSTIRSFRSQDSIEVGILQGEKPDELEELSLGGYLTVLGQDTKPSGTMFSFPSRHHPLPPSAASQTFSTSFQHPTGLHPTLQIHFPPTSPPLPPRPGCALHAYLTLPSALFLDKYQFTDPLFLASQNLLRLRSISGAQDLEAPDWVLRTWGSASLFELANPTSGSNKVNSAAPQGEKGWMISIPTHLRYLFSTSRQQNATTSSQSGNPGYLALTIPSPTLFWACEAQEGLKFPTNPFDRVNLGYEGLFGPKTLFYHIPPSYGGNGSSSLLHELSVPVLETEEAAKWVPAATAVAVLLGFAWIVWQLYLGVSGKDGKKKNGEGHGKTE